MLGKLVWWGVGAGGGVGGCVPRYGRCVRGGGREERRGEPFFVFLFSLVVCLVGWLID